jgi:hypothetical protein
MSRIRLTYRSSAPFHPSVTDTLFFLFLFDLPFVAIIETSEFTETSPVPFIAILVAMADPTKLLLDLNINSGCVRGLLQLATPWCCIRF